MLFKMAPLINFSFGKVRKHKKDENAHIIGETVSISVIPNHLFILQGNHNNKFDAQYTANPTIKLYKAHFFIS